MHAAKQMRLSRNDRRSAADPQFAQLVDRVHPAEAELGLAPDGADVLHRRERLRPLGLVGHIGVQQRQVELHVDGFLEELPGQVQPPFRRVDVLIQIQHEVVRHDGVTGGKERDKPGNEVAFGRCEPPEVGQVRVQIYFLHGPRVADGVLEPVVELRVPHRPQRQVHAGIQEHAAARGAFAVTGRPRSSPGSRASTPPR